MDLQQYEGLAEAREQQDVWAHIAFQRSLTGEDAQWRAYVARAAVIDDDRRRPSENEGKKIRSP